MDPRDRETAAVTGNGGSLARDGRRDGYDAADALVRYALDPHFFSSPVETQPPLVSAFWIAVLNFVSADMRQAVSALGAPVPMAFCHHLSFAAIFFAAALFFAMAQTSRPALHLSGQYLWSP